MGIKTMSDYRLYEARKSLESQNIPFTWGYGEGPVCPAEFNPDATFIIVAGFKLSARQVVRLYEDGQLTLLGIHAFAEHAGVEAHWE
jgi:hypothetical protein